MVTDIELASVKLVGKFCRRSEGELLRVGDWRMKLYGIACREDLPRESLLASAREIARDQLSKETVNNYRVGFVGVHDGRDAAFVFVDFGETRTNCSIAHFFLETTIPRSYLRRSRRTRRFAFGICICNPSSERLGLSMCCASRTLLTLMVILRNVGTKMRNF